MPGSLRPPARSLGGVEKAGDVKGGGDRVGVTKVGAKRR